MSKHRGKQILIVDDEQENIDILRMLLSNEECVIHFALNGEQALEITKKNFFHLIILDIRMPKKNGIQVLEELHKRDESPHPLILLLTAYGTKDNIERALKSEVFDILEKPIDNELLLLKIKNALRYFDVVFKNAQMEGEKEYEYPYHNVVGSSIQFRKILDEVKKIASTDSFVSILGETGTGKELIARAIHAESTRSQKTFKVINAGVMPDKLLESELFGHEKGASSVTTEKKIGYLEAGRGSTLLLKEVDKLNLQNQLKLLSVLLEKKIKRLGGTEEIDIDVRIILTTQKDLNKMVEEGTFDSALYDRMKSIAITLPPLRKKKEDIPHLINFFISQLSTRNITLSFESQNMLNDYNYPGNVRELRYIIKQAINNLGEGNTVLPHHLPSAISGRSNDLLKKFVTPTLYEKLESDPKSLEPQFEYIAVGFVDIRDSTGLVQRLDATQINELLRLFFNFTVACIEHFGGIVDKFTGDGVMWFHKGHTLKEDSELAIKAAVKIIKGMKKLNKKISDNTGDRKPIHIGIGISCGMAIVGIFGDTNNRIHYTAIGIPVNCAARLCSKAPKDTILIGGPIIKFCNHKITEISDEIELKNFEDTRVMRIEL